MGTLFETSFEHIISFLIYLINERINQEHNVEKQKKTYLVCLLIMKNFKILIQNFTNSTIVIKILQVLISSLRKIIHAFNLVFREKVVQDGEIKFSNNHVPTEIQI